MAAVPNDGWMRRLRGRFLVFDGPDGSGKSTQFRRFADRAVHAGLSVCEVRDPGGTAIGEQIRQVLLDPANEPMAITCEMLLYMASRAQLVEERIRPARERGDLVLADRFISSTLAYQGAAGGYDQNAIRAVGQVVVGDCQPDLTVVFDVDQATASHRLNPLLDRMEQKGEAFHRKVRQGYLDQARQEPERYLVIDARPQADAVAASLHEALAARFSAQA